MEPYIRIRNTASESFKILNKFTAVHTELIRKYHRQQKYYGKNFFVILKFKLKSTGENTVEDP